MGDLLGGPQFLHALFEMRAYYSPGMECRILGARDYILHRSRHLILSSNWKPAEPGEIVYAAGTLGVHIRNSYHNAFRTSKRAIRKQTMYTRGQYSSVETQRPVI